MEEKEPVPVPFDVFVVKAMVGLVLVDQTIPLPVIEAPPSDVIFPPDEEDVAVIAVMTVVVKVGMETMVMVSFRQRTEAPDDLMLKSKKLLFLYTVPLL